MSQPPPPNLIQRLLHSTLPTRLRYGLTRHQIIHNWRKHVSYSHPQLLTTDLFPEETKMLLEAFSRSRPTNYLEIGVFWGGTFRNVLRHRDSLGMKTTCYAIDIWDELKDSAETTHGTGQPIKSLVHRALATEGLGNFKLLTGLSNDITNLISWKLDLVFHDANHTYQSVFEDMEILHTLMSDSGTLLVHNAGKEYQPDKMYYETDGGPYKAVMEQVESGKWQLDALDYRMALLTRIP